MDHVETVATVPVSQPKTEESLKLKGENDFFQELQDKIKTLHANFLRAEEEKTKTAVLHEQEKKEIKEANQLMYRKFNDLSQRVESEVGVLKLQNTELQHKLLEEQLQKEKEKDNHATKIARLNKLVKEKDDIIMHMNNKIDAVNVDHKEQIKVLLEKFNQNEEQLCSLRKDIQLANAKFSANVNDIDVKLGENAEQELPKLDSLCDQEVPLQNISTKEAQLTFDNDSQSEESEEEMGDILDHFVTTTSMHGIGQIIGNKWLVLRILWILLTLGALGGLIFHLYSIIDSFRKWPKQTQVSVGLNNSVYPAVTICNENIIRKSALENVHALHSLKTFVNYTSQVKFAERKFSSSNRTDANMISLNTKLLLETLETLSDKQVVTEEERYMIEAALNRSLDNGYESSRDMSYLLEEIFQTIYMHVDRDSRSKAGHQLSDMLISCTFNGYTCYPGNFSLYQTSSLGNCWTLANPAMTADTTGPRAGLSLVLFLQNYECLEGISLGYGTRLALHAQGTRPIPDEEGLFISSASETNIGLSKGQITRVGLPHGKCNDGISFQDTYNISYSRQVCQIMCLMEKIISTCGCYGNFHEEFAILVNDKAHVCSSAHERNCLDSQLQNLEEKNKLCACDNPCSETYFYTSVSSRRWPTDTYAQLLLEKVCEKLPTACQQLKEDTDSRHLLDNFVKVNIFFETLNYEEIEEKPLMDAFQLLASIGGALGLWVGLSVLSFCEIVQLVVKILDFIFCPQKCIRVPTPK